MKSDRGQQDPRPPSNKFAVNTGHLSKSVLGLENVEEGWSGVLAVLLKVETGVRWGHGADFFFFFFGIFVNLICFIVFFSDRGGCMGRFAGLIEQ